MAGLATGLLPVELWAPILDLVMQDGADPTLVLRGSLAGLIQVLLAVPA